MQKEEQNQNVTPARDRVRDFFYHLVVYLFCLMLLFLVSSLGGAFIWIALFWGFAVALHGVYAVFG